MEFLGKFGPRIHQTRVQHGFQTTWENLPMKVMLVVTELSEAIEAHRTIAVGIGSLDGYAELGERDADGQLKVPRSEFEKLKAALGEEFADAIIRILDICYSLGIPLEEQMKLKLEANEKRPHLHGKRY